MAVFKQDIEDISDTMERVTGIKGQWLNVFDGKLFWRVLVKGENSFSIYNENDQLTQDEEVANYILPTVKEYLKENK